jgi:CheY-like chemotaxis protein
VHRRAVLGPLPERKVVFFSSLLCYSKVYKALERQSLGGEGVTVLAKPVGPQAVHKALGLLLGFQVESTLHHRLEDLQSDHRSSSEEDVEDVEVSTSPRPATTPEEAEGEGDAGAESLDVLVVEDNPVAQTVLRKQLEKLQVRFQVTSSGEESVEIWERSPGGIPLVLMDVEVDGPINGLEATKAIRAIERTRRREQRGKRRQSAEAQERLPRSFIAIMTGRAMESDREEAFVAGCDTFLPKPVRLENIKEMVFSKVPSVALNSDGTS